MFTFNLTDICLKISGIRKTAAAFAFFSADIASVIMMTAATAGTLTFFVVMTAAAAAADCTGKQSTFEQFALTAFVRGAGNARNDIDSGHS